jgi:hypothetical protein
VLLQATLQHLIRTGVPEELRRALYLQFAAWQDRNRGSTLLDPLGQAMRVLRPVGRREQRPKVLCEAVVKCRCRLRGRAPGLVAAGELDAIGREAIAEERQAGALGGIEVIEHGQ